MTTHAEATPSAPDHSAEPHAATEDSLHFEKSELHDFVAADRSAGEHVGILLAAVFCISLVLLGGVTYWTANNQGQGHDPHTLVGAEDSGHH
jgi:hypothetical protein